MAAAYAVALQMLLTGIAAAHLAARTTMAPADLSIICFHRNPDGAPDRPGQPVHQLPCLLCTLATAAPAILPALAGYTVQPSTGASMSWTPAGLITPAKHSTPRLSQGPPPST
jgi:hypothetical protein